MKLYRDMTPAERAEADKEHQWLMELNKHDAEEEMMWFDSLLPAERKTERNREFY